MLETTENVNLFLPIIFALFISFAVGRLFSKSLYALSIDSKSVPFLIETVPSYNVHLQAKSIITKEVVMLKEKASVNQILEVLNKNNQEINGFPVISL